MNVDKFSAARRRALRMIGLGAAGTAITAVVSPNRVFAKQFAGPVTPVKLPEMTYDPNLQMMVDPATRRPIYPDSQKVATINATITAGCADCPKCDDACG